MSEKASDDQNSELQRMITANKARLLQAQKTLSDLKKRTGEIPTEPESGDRQPSPGPGKTENEKQVEAEPAPPLS